jgi:hypothetical protein
MLVVVNEISGEEHHVVYEPQQGVVTGLGHVTKKR